MILSAGKDGVVAVSSLADGAITRVIEDHRGAPVTAIHCVNEQVGAERQKSRKHTRLHDLIKPENDVSIIILHIVQLPFPK